MKNDGLGLTPISLDEVLKSNQELVGNDISYEDRKALEDFVEVINKDMRERVIDNYGAEPLCYISYCRKNEDSCSLFLYIDGIGHKFIEDDMSIITALNVCLFLQSFLNISNERALMNNEINNVKDYCQTPFTEGEVNMYRNKVLTWLCETIKPKNIHFTDYVLTLDDENQLYSAKKVGIFKRLAKIIALNWQAYKLKKEKQ